MQINPFGFPLGAGTQPASAFGGTGLGFIDALGVAIEGGIPQPFASTGNATTLPQPTPTADATVTLPQSFDLNLYSTPLATPALAEPLAQPVKAAATLPGLQQPTSLAQLMATAAKLPTADPVVPAAPVAQPVAPTPETGTTAPATPAIVPAKPGALAACAPPPEGEATLLPEADAQPEASSVTVATETPAKPTKPRVRATAAEAQSAQPDATQPAVPAGILAAVVPQQTAQLQTAPREFAAPQGNGVTTLKKTVAAGASATDATQPGSTSVNATDFARAVAAQGESTGSEANADGQPRPEVQLAAAAKADAAAPLMPHATHATTTSHAAATAAPAVAEPVIDARSGHLGHAMGVEIARKVELGEETLRIRLNPIELGRIEVTLAFDDKGSLQATVRTESARAMDLLRQDAPDLARTLDQAGVRTDAQSFRFENRGGDSGGQQAQQHQQSNRGQFASSDDDAIAAEPIYRPVRSDGQVDLLA
jgi:flagellar hook-length control protein FliK